MHENIMYERFVVTGGGVCGGPHPASVVKCETHLKSENSP